MKILLYADPHWSVNSSIVRSRGDKYSARLENLIASINWVEELAYNKNCDTIVCLGDFFDTAQLNSEEITALGEIKWDLSKHYFLAGNHEMGRGDQSFSSSTIFDLCPNACAITAPTILPIYDQRDTRIVCIPYILEKDRKPLKEYLENLKGYLAVENLIILSHNDISGIQMGNFVSTSGFSVEEIKENCKLFINGHLHNGDVIAPGIINLGNLTGQNFSEDGLKYKHQVMIIDTETHEVEFIENPYAFKFYKLDFSGYDESMDSYIQSTLDTLPGPAVVTVKVAPNNEFLVKDLLSTMHNIVESRVIIDMRSTARVDNTPTLNVNRDHFSRFASYIIETLGASDIVKEELVNICGDTLCD